MIREFFSIGSFPISPFGVMMVAAFTAAYFQLRKGLEVLELGDEEDASSILFGAGFGGILGGKIYYAMLYGDWRLIFDRAGLVWYGGFLLGTAAVLWTLRQRRLPFAGTLDAAMPALALGYGVGRIGCFLVGDDYGKPTSLPWGVEFKVGLPPTTAGNLRQQFGVDVPAEIADSTFLAVHPTQLYETLVAFLLWGLGLWLLRRRLTTGVTALVVLAGLAIERFGVEFLRAKDDRFLGALTLAQAISVAILLVVGILALRLRASRRAA